MRFMRTAQNTEPAASTQTRIDAPEGAYLLLVTLREDKKGAAASDYGQDLQKGAICPVLFGLHVVRSCDHDAGVCAIAVKIAAQA